MALTEMFECPHCDNQHWDADDAAMCCEEEYSTETVYRCPGCDKKHNNINDAGGCCMTTVSRIGVDGGCCHYSGPEFMDVYRSVDGVQGGCCHAAAWKALNDLTAAEREQIGIDQEFAIPMTQELANELRSTLDIDVDTGDGLSVNTGSQVLVEAHSMLQLTAEDRWVYGLATGDGAWCSNQPMCPSCTQLAESRRLRDEEVVEQHRLLREAEGLELLTEDEELRVAVLYVEMQQKITHQRARMLSATIGIRL